MFIKKIKKNSLFNKIYLNKYSFSKLFKEQKNKISKMYQLITKQPIFQCLINMKYVSYKVLGYLNIIQLNNMYKALSTLNQNNQEIQEFKNLVVSFIFNKQWINKIDRGMSYLIYDQKICQSFDQMSILNIAVNYSQIAFNLHKNFNNLFNNLQTYANMSKNQVQLIKQMITDPSISLPSLLRYNLAKHFNSSYQTFIYSNTYCNNIKMDQQSNYQSFKNLIKSNEQKYLKQFIKACNNEFSKKKNNQKIMQLVNNKQNFIQSINIYEDEEQYIEGNQIFNFFFIITKLIKNLLISYKVQIRSVQNDPYTQFYQLLLRFSTFKNLIIQLNEQFKEVFQIFSEMINQVKDQQISGNSNFFSFKDLMGLFFQELNQQIIYSIKTYKNLIHKMRLTQNNEIYSIQQQQKQNLFEYFDQFQGSPTLQYIFEEQEDMQRIKNILNDYSEMFVDMSVNSQNISWTGHSQQIMEKPFYTFENTIIQLQKNLLNNMPVNEPEVLKRIIVNEINFLQKDLNIKPRTIKSILKELNIYIPFSFQKKDQELQFLNANLNHQTKQFSSNVKIYSSLITAASDNQQESGNQWEYISQASQHSIHEEQMDLQI